ncbi:hypothetical protein HHI36_009790 [Cryptolaemus montrouzieri]|uniref:Uncharacterized protein n=1 Tax=Cryptolaemus montrouzieri TaxID=559131 RepID=A0ABD2MGW4_9CUCU
MAKASHVNIAVSLGNLKDHTCGSMVSSTIEHPAPSLVLIRQCNSNCGLDGFCGFCRANVGSGLVWCWLSSRVLPVAGRVAELVGCCWYFCRQETLQKHQPCLAELLQNGKNTCPGTSHFSETSTTQIDANKILIIPAEPTKIRSLCNTEGIHEIAKPSIITLDGCRVSIGGKEFQTEQTTHEEFLFELPEVELPLIYEENRKTLNLKNIDQEQILQINTFANNLRITELQKLNESKHPWYNTLIIIVTAISISSVLIYKKLRKSRKPRSQISTQSTKISKPLFSSLGREQLHC